MKRPAELVQPIATADVQVARGVWVCARAYAGAGGARVVMTMAERDSSGSLIATRGSVSFAAAELPNVLEALRQVGDAS